jgi:cytochrome c
MRTISITALACAALVTFPGAAFAEGDAAKGKADFTSKCGICHQIGENAKAFVGPALTGVVGRKAASVADFTGYSAGMKKLGQDGWVWTEENIDKWIGDPKALIPDSTMSMGFTGVPDAQERADIIAYLKENSK